MEQILKERHLEAETYAIINFFKLLRQAEVAELETYDNKYFPDETFVLIGGVDSFNRLLIDYQRGNIDFFSNSIGNLFTKLEENINCLKNIKFTKSILLDKAMTDFEIIKKFYSEVYSINGNPNEAAIYDLMVLPVPKDMIQKIIINKPKEKILRER